MSRLAAKIEKELRQRYQIAPDDRILGAVARQAGRQHALSEKLAEDMLTGEIEHQRRMQERWASAVRGFRKAVDKLEASSGATVNGRGLDLARRLAQVARERGR